VAQKNRATGYRGSKIRQHPVNSRMLTDRQNSFSLRYSGKFVKKKSYLKHAIALSRKISGTFSSHNGQYPVGQSPGWPVDQFLRHSIYSLVLLRCMNISSGTFTVACSLATGRKPETPGKYLAVLRLFERKCPANLEAVTF